MELSRIISTKIWQKKFRKFIGMSNIHHCICRYQEMLIFRLSSSTTNGHFESPKLGAKVDGEMLEPPAAKRRHVEKSEPLEDYSRFNMGVSEPAKTVRMCVCVRAWV